MKKSISINIQGMIFNIEEDGYEKLRIYLESLRAHFRNYQDSNEILNDIESRIAEIFQTKLSKSKEVITYEDVEEVMSVLGHVSDFEEEGVLEEDLIDESQSNQETKNERSSESGKEEEKTRGGTSDSKGSGRGRGPKRIYRDKKRRIFGGVASGIANYFGIDPVFVRIIIILFIFGFIIIPGVNISLGPLMLITYFILWIILPGSRELQNQNRLFRDGEDGLIGGVAAGIAKYIGVEPLYVRLILLVCMFFSATTIPIYILLWIIVPKAKTLAEKMQMQGKPLTVDNIESKIKDNFNLKDEGRDDENLLTKIIFFPFRILGIILKAIGPVLKGVIDFAVLCIRFALGTMLIAVALSIVFGLILVVATGLGMTLGGGFEGLGVDVDVLQGSIPVLVHFAVFFVGIIPTVIMGMLGISLLLRKNIIRPIFLGTSFGIWILSLGFLIVSIVMAPTEFSYEGKVQTVKKWDISNEELVLDVRGYGHPNFDMTNIWLERYDSQAVKVVVTKAAQGNSLANARKNAEMVTYTYEMVDSTLVFDDHYTFNDSAIFRIQRVNVKIYVPRDLKVIQTERFKQELGSHITIDLKDRYNRNYSGREGNTLSPEESEALKSIIPNPFRKIEVNDAFNVEIFQSERDSVSITGSRRLMKYMEYRQIGMELNFDYGAKDIFSQNIGKKEQILVQIWTKTPEQLDFSGAASVRLMNLEGESLEIRLSDAAACEGTVEVDRLNINMESATFMRLKGAAGRLAVQAEDASEFNGYDLVVTDAILDLNKASNATINARGKLVADINNASSLRYKGTPEMEVESSYSSSVEQIP